MSYLGMSRRGAGSAVYSQAGRLCPPAFAFGYGVAGPAGRLHMCWKITQIRVLAVFPDEMRRDKPLVAPPRPQFSTLILAFADHRAPFLDSD